MLFTFLFTLIPGKDKAWSLGPTLQLSTKTVKRQEWSYSFFPLPLYECFCDKQFTLWEKRSKPGLAVNTLMTYGVIWKKCTYIRMLPVYVSMITKVKMNYFL